jgi:predicted permease
MQIPLLEGRFFNDGDTADSPPVVIVDKYLVDRYFPARSALGQQIRRGGPTSPPFTIVGVVRTINAIDLGQPVLKERLYYPVMQQTRPSMGLVLKTGLDPTSLVAQVRSAVQSIDPEQPIAEVRTMDRWVSRSLETRRTPMTLLGIFGAVALLLSAIGIYGVLAFAVAQRVREFGIRQALGADRHSILSLVLTQGAKTTGAGIVLGLAGSFALARYLRSTLQSVLFEVKPFDLTVVALVTLALAVVALVACYVPARRATRIDPMAALRQG